VADRVAEPAGPKTLAVDRARLTAADERLQALARARVNTATPHEAHPLERRHPGPGLGTLLRLVRRDDRPDLDRWPPGPEVVAAGRWGPWATASAGTRWGTAGHNLGTAPRQWACAAAAAGVLRHPPAGPPSLARWEPQHAQGQAVPLLAHTRARAVSDRRTRHPAGARAPSRQGSGRSARAPGASRAAPGSSRSRA